MYFLLGICLLLFFLLTLNLLASVSASLLWRVVSKRAKHLSSRKQEQIIFALRAFPVIAALIFVSTFMLPAYVLYEPESSGEAVTVKLAVISLACLLGIGIAAFRVIGTWRITRQLTANWLKHSQSITVDDVNIPVYRMEHPFPVIAVVGMLRPKMFVAEQIFTSLSRDQFRAAIAHEYGHLTARDNFKRAFLRVCRDILIFPLGRELDKAWAENTEAAADEYAAEIGGNSMALDLAEALIKVARIVPPNTRPAIPLGSYVMGAHEGDLKNRIRRLLAIADDNDRGTIHKLKLGYSKWLYLCGALLVSLLVISNTNLLLAIHDITENVVAFLQ